MRRYISVFTLFVSLLGGRFAAAGPQAAPEGKSEIQVAEPRVLTLPAITYFYKSVEANLTSQSERINEAIGAVIKTAGDGNARIVGPPVIVFHGVTRNPKVSFTFEVGFPVAPDAKPAADCKVTKLAELRALSVLYSGPPTGLAAAYQKLSVPFSRGDFKPAEESRQMMLYWEGLDSPNNVFQVMIGIQ